MAEHIQIGAVAPRIQYTADGTQTAFTYPFPIFTDADMEVYEDDALKTLATDYTVSGAGDSAGGTVTFGVAPAAGVGVTLRRNITIQRTSDFQEGGDLRAKTLNDDLDYLTAAIQQVESEGERTLKLAATDPDSGIALPTKTERASKFLAFDVDGVPIGAIDAGAYPASAFGASLIDDADAAAARATLGIGAAATLNVGTGANDLVQLDGSAKLPAVDGSQLTELPTAGFVSVQYFTGSGTWTRPADITKIRVRGWSGGGGGARKNSGPIPFGGSSGGYFEEVIDVTSVPSVAVTVGGGGAGGPADGTSGSAGGTTSFGSYCSCAGGGGGNVGSAGSVPTPTGGALNLAGQVSYSGATAGGYPFPGGNAPLGGGGGMGDTSSGGTSGGFPGGGGQGGNNVNGGAGAAGLVIVEEYK